MGRTHRVRRFRNIIAPPTRSRATATTNLLTEASSSPTAGRTRTKLGLLIRDAMASYLRSGHVVAWHRHLRDVHQKGESAGSEARSKLAEELYLEPLLA